ncbi:MAG: hypothetical protein ACRD1F_04705, partial [Terriglobales bacterium]
MPPGKARPPAVFEREQPVVEARWTPAGSEALVEPLCQRGMQADRALFHDCAMALHQPPQCKCK